MKESTKNTSKIILPVGFTLTAHTGCENTPDNSLEAITKGFESSADIVEFDVRFLSDGTPILSHDKTESADVTLDDALKLVSGYEGLKVNLDIKTKTNLPAVLETVKKYSLLSRVFFTGIELNDIDTVKKQTPEIEYYLNIGVSRIRSISKKYLLSLADTTKNCGAVGINMSHKSCTKKLVEIFHERGLQVSVWTVNTPKSMKRILSFGVDNITTRKPTELKKMIEGK